MKRAIVLASLLLACAGVSAQSVRPATDAEVQSIKQGSSTVLKDAISALYRDVQAISLGPEAGDGIVAFCGLVNAKNSHGGYVGFQRFYGMGGNAKSGGGFGASIMFVDAPGDAVGMGTEMCRRNGF